MTKRTLGFVATAGAGRRPLGFPRTVITPDRRLCTWTKLRISACNPNDKEEESSWLFYERSLAQVSRSQSR